MPKTTSLYKYPLHYNETPLTKPFDEMPNKGDVKSIFMDNLC